MQAATHLAAGAALAAAFPGRRRLTMPLAALAHPLLDDIALATYHPPDPAWGDPFWVGYHAAVLIATLATLMAFRRHAWILAAAMIPDLDWIASPLGLWDRETLHIAFRAIPGIAWMSAGLRTLVPDLRLIPTAALAEIPLYATLVIGARVLESRTPATRN